MTKKILFIGGFYGEGFAQKYLQTPDQQMQTASNEFQRRLFNGFNENGYIVDVIALPFMKPYSKLNENKHIKALVEYYGPNKITHLAFNNIFGIKNFSRAKALRLYIKKALKDPSFHDYECVYIYSAHTPFLAALPLIKRKYKHLKIVMNIVDLPQFVTDKKAKLLYKILKVLDVKLFTHKIKQVDLFVLITKYMAEKLNIPASSYLVVEGISDASIINTAPSEKFLRPTLAYTGLVEEKFIIDILINGFLALNNPHYDLIISGKGFHEPTITEYTKQYPNIKYLGTLPHLDTIILQRKAHILIEPRLNDTYTKYSVPSKMMEYLSSGSHIISFKLDSFPEKFNSVIHYFPEPSPESLAATINDVFTFEDTTRLVEKNITFVQENLVSGAVTLKIINFIVNYKKGTGKA